MDFGQLLTTSNVVLAFKFYNYATIAYSAYHAYITVKYVYNTSSGITKKIYKVCVKENIETNTKKDDSKVEKDYTKEEWEVL
tara:strand:+ start:289 stop:534 length:246 start_codon:yes stop_codon:yes gene_type:complete